MSNVRNFADNNTLFSCGDNLSIILKSLEHGVKIFLRWFNVNTLKANPEKFQFMILGKSLQPEYCLIIGSINVKESDHVELLGITTDKHLSFKTDTENLFQNVNYKLLGNAFINSQFNYACLIWMFCQKTFSLRLKRILCKKYFELFTSQMPLIVIC